MTKKELIFNAGAKLFAEQSFDSVGIRSIASEAEVNSAMISYYYGGKSELLRTIFETFCERIVAISREAFERASGLDELCDIVVPVLLDDAKENRDLYLVGLRQLNTDKHNLQDLRAWLQERSDEMFSQFLLRCGLHEKKVTDDNIVFGAFMGMVFSDYLLGGGAIIDDPAKSEEYAETIVAILKNGLPFLVE